MSKRKRKHISRKIQDNVRARDRHQCLVCDATENLCLDHIIPESRGGESTEENLQVLCRTCNAIKQNYLLTIDDLKVCLQIHHEIRELERKNGRVSIYIHAYDIVKHYCKRKGISLADL